MEFKFQYFWARTFLLLPLIIVLPIVEYEIFVRFKIFNLIFFLLFSIGITFIVAFKLYRRTGMIFIKTGYVTICDEKICIQKGKKYIIEKGNIRNVEIKKIKIYDVCMAMFTLTYEKNYKKRKLYIYSEDVEKSIKKCTLWGVYQEVKKYINVIHNKDRNYVKSGAGEP